jgi:hypothetical protein
MITSYYLLLEKSRSNNFPEKNNITFATLFRVFLKLPYKIFKKLAAMKLAVNFFEFRCFCYFREPFFSVLIMQGHATA